MCAGRGSGRQGEGSWQVVASGIQRKEERLTLQSSPNNVDMPKLLQLKLSEFPASRCLSRAWRGKATSAAASSSGGWPSTMEKVWIWQLMGGLLHVCVFMSICEAACTLARVFAFLCMQTCGSLRHIQCENCSILSCQAYMCVCSSAKVCSALTHLNVTGCALRRAALSLLS